MTNSNGKLLFGSFPGPWGQKVINEWGRVRPVRRQPLAPASLFNCWFLSSAVSGLRSGVLMSASIGRNLFLVKTLWKMPVFPQGPVS